MTVKELFFLILSALLPLSFTGCGVFNEDMRRDSPPADIEVSLGNPEQVPNTPGVPIYPWFPDGHISVIPKGDDLEMYWAGSSSYRTTGPAINKMFLSPAHPVITGEEDKEAFDNGGAWLMSVTPLSDTHYLGFYHAEDHEYLQGKGAEGEAWKSIALCESHDSGQTWSKKGQIITSLRPKPDVPTWGGSGDHCTVYDKVSSRWFCFYQEHFICMAVSDDQNASPGTWKKWYNGAFSEPGLGGNVSPIDALTSHPGGNPSVHYNTSLQQWIMVWHTWDGYLVYSVSPDLMHWKQPSTLVRGGSDEKVWYPTIIDRSDTVAGESAVLYYAFWPDKNHWQRQFIQRTIRFKPGRSGE
jgi:hypothetical protein